MRRHHLSLSLALSLVLSAVAFAADNSAVAGKWDGHFSTPGPKGTLRLDLKQDADSLKGTVLLDGKDGHTPQGEIRNAKTSGDTLSFDTVLEGAQVTFSGTQGAGKLTGTMLIHEGTNVIHGEWDAQRSTE